MDSDYEFGRTLYETGKPFEACLTEEQMNGWQDAAADGEDAYLLAMEEAEYDARLATDQVAEELERAAWQEFYNTTIGGQI